MIDLPSFSFSISCHTCCLTFGSNPVVGSSSNMILGLPIADIAKLSLLFIPPLKLATLFFFYLDKFTNASISSIFWLICYLGMFFNLANMYKWSSAVSSPHKMSNCEQTPMYFLISSILSILRLLMMIYKSGYSSGLITPVKMLINVVLPAPLWPKMPINSFGYISRLKFFIASTFLLENTFLNVLLKHFILSPNAGMFAPALRKTLLRYLIVDSY